MAFRINFIEQSTPVSASLGNIYDELIVLIGKTSATGGTVPPAGSMTRCHNTTDDAVFGDFADGTIPQGLLSIRAQNHDEDVVVIRVDNTYTLDHAIADLSNVIKFADKNVTRVCIQEDTWNDADNNGVPDTDTVTILGTLNHKLEEMKCTGYVGTGDTTVANAKIWAANNPNDRINAVFGYGKVPGGATDINLAAAFCGAVARSAENRGYGISANYFPINLQSVKTPVSFSVRSASAGNQQLSDDNIWCVIGDDNGYHIWGNDLLVAGTSTAKDRYLNVRTILDRFEIYMTKQQKPIAGTNIGPATVTRILALFEEELSRLKNAGLVEDTDSVREDSEYNTIANLHAGNVGFLVNLNPFAPVANSRNTIITAGV